MRTFLNKRSHRCRLIGLDFAHLGRTDRPLLFFAARFVLMNSELVFLSCLSSVVVFVDCVAASLLGSWFHQGHFNKSYVSECYFTSKLVNVQLYYSDLYITESATDRRVVVDGKGMMNGVRLRHNQSGHTLALLHSSIVLFVCCWTPRSAIYHLYHNSQEITENGPGKPADDIKGNFPCPQVPISHRAWPLNAFRRL